MPHTHAMLHLLGLMPVAVPGLAAHIGSEVAVFTRQKLVLIDTEAEQHHIDAAIAQIVSRASVEHLAER